MFDNEPMVHQLGAGPDFLFCMRVEATSGEVAAFVSREFQESQRVGADVDEYGNGCAAPLGVNALPQQTIAYERRRGGSKGAAVEDGLLYYWDAKN